jgi:hypothetical protein
MCTSTAIWIFRCLNEWLRSIARIPEANVTFNKRGNKSEAEKTMVTCLFLAFGDRGREGWSIQIGRGGCLPCRRNGSPSVYLLCMIPPSKSISLSQRVCSVIFVHQELCHSSWPSPLSTAPTATNVPICGLDLAVVELSPTVPGVPPRGCVALCTDPNSAYVTTMSSPPVTT